MNRRGFLSGLLGTAAAAVVPVDALPKLIPIDPWVQAPLTELWYHDHIADAFRYGVTMWQTKSDGAYMRRIDPRDFFTGYRYEPAASNRLPETWLDEAPAEWPRAFDLARRGSRSR